MDDKTLRRNTATSVILCILCILVGIAALLLQWKEAAIIMAALSLLQAYFIFLWLNRSRRRKKHTKEKKHD